MAEGAHRRKRQKLREERRGGLQGLREREYLQWSHGERETLDQKKTGEDQGLDQRGGSSNRKGERKSERVSWERENK